MEELIRLNVLLQSTIHKIEDLQGSSSFKHELKKRTNSYLKFIERVVEPMTKQMDLDESQSYIDIVSNIDKTINNLKITKHEL